MPIVVGRTQSWGRLNTGHQMTMQYRRKSQASVVRRQTRTQPKQFYLKVHIYPLICETYSKQYKSSKLLGSHWVRDVPHQLEDAKTNINCCRDHMIMTNWRLQLCSEIIYRLISGQVGSSEMLLPRSNKCFISLGRKDNVISPITIRSF